MPKSWCVEEFGSRISWLKIKAFINLTFNEVILGDRAFKGLIKVKDSHNSAEKSDSTASFIQR